MQFTQTPLRRRLAGGLAAALVAGSAATLGAVAPAQAVPVAPTLSWNISEQFVRHLYLSQAGPTLPVTPKGTVADGAAYVQGDITDSSDDHFTFAAKDTVAGPDGSKVFRYGGTVDGAFVVGATTYYTVKVADPVVRIEADGSGSVNATVSGTVPGDNLATGPTYVKVADFTDLTELAAVEGAYTATPAWADVLPAGSVAATDLEIAAGQPVEGKSFHPEFLGALPSGVRAHFYASGGNSDAYKTVGTLDFSAPAEVLTPTVTTQVLDASSEDGLSIRVNGSGFSASTVPGDAGVYVALAPVSTVIDFADRGSLADIPAVDYVTPARFSGNGFTAVLNVNPEDVVKGTEYAVFTWQAHTHSNSTQDTKTPVRIDWSKYDVPAPTPTPTPTATPTATPTVKPTPTPTATPTPTPTATPTATPTVTPTVKPTPTVVPKPTVTVKPAPKPVKKATKVTAKVKKKATRKKSGKLAVTVKAGKANAAGKVTVVIKAPGKKTVKKVVRIKKGKVSVTLPKAKKKGTYKVSVTYKGATKFKAAKKKAVKFRVR